MMKFFSNPFSNASKIVKGGSAKPSKTDDLSPDDIIIAVMGPTGSGKSTFINIITGFEKANVGHKLKPCTEKVEKFRHSLPSLVYGDLVFVDTPGFDDVHKSERDVLEVMDDWLKSTYGEGVKLSGLLYFHRISDNRKPGTPLAKLGMFEKLCGKNALQKVILTTTMWDSDEVAKEMGEAEERERDLKSEYWQPMLWRNSTINRFWRTRESAFTVIDPLIEAVNIQISDLLNQELENMRLEQELANKNKRKKLSSASQAAGQNLFPTMELLLRQREDLLRRIRNEIKRGAGDGKVLASLQDEYEKLKIDMESTIEGMRGLNIPLGERLVKMTDKILSSDPADFTFKRFNVGH